MTRIEMSRSGRWAVVGGLELVDLLGTAARRRLPAGVGRPWFVGAELWCLGGGTLRRFAAASLEELPGADLDARELVVGYGAAAVDAVAVGDGAPVRVSVRSGYVAIDPLELAPHEAVVAVHGQRVLAYGRGVLRAIDRGRVDVWRTRHVTGEVSGASVILGGRAIAALVRGADGGPDQWRVLRANGELIHAVEVPAATSWAVAEEQGHAFVLCADGKLARVDLRYGRVVEIVAPPVEVRALAVDHDSRHLVLAGVDGRGEEILHVVVGSVFRGPRADAAATANGSATGEDHTGDDGANGHGANGHAVEHGDGPPPVAAPVALSPPSSLPPHAERTDAAEGDAPVVEPAPRAPRLELPDLPALAFGPPPPTAAAAGGQAPYHSAREHLDALLDVVASRTALAIADAWNSGRLSASNATIRPHEIEVSALIGGSGGFAAEQLAETKRGLEQRQREAAARVEASVARGVRLPFPELAREAGLSAVGAQVLLVVAAPALRGEITRLYGVLGNDAGRPVVDRFLIEQIIAGGRSVVRDHIARELAPDAPLVRHGFVHVDREASWSLFSRLTVPDALLDRLRGLTLARQDDVSTVRAADRRLADLYVPDDVKRELVLAVAEPRDTRDPLRLVLRGRRGSGRHALVAALAATVSREIVAIDATRLPRAPRELGPALRHALFRASLHGSVPVVSGLEQLARDDAEIRELLRQVIRSHPGPLVVRTTPEGLLPLDAGFQTVTLPAFTETQRSEAWRMILDGAQVEADADTLARRYRIGPGVITEVVASIAGRHRAERDATAAIDAQVSQHVATRLDHVASRVTRLAGWEDIALPDEMLDSLREFVARSRYRRTVFERWGYDSKMSTSRGLTALFYGPPGTGKTMVAGVIARELGLDMYRVDLARVVSKWVGETEKNLAEVFDGAEDGQVMILFDEADSLFAKRTDVKTSNDRYANLEVNYLLQRLDTFEGVAILTSNLDGAIDPAFKRRLSLRLQFPFPDEEVRLRLWQAHVTPQTPTLGDFDFGDLARRFALSGGYIRNCAIRAAFLAAHEGIPLAQEHLLRAIQLEYRELGKLSTSSRME